MQATVRRFQRHPLCSQATHSNALCPFSTLGPVTQHVRRQAAAPSRRTTSWTRAWASTWPRWAAGSCCGRSASGLVAVGAAACGSSHVERGHVGGRDPRRDGGPLPRRRVERARTCSPSRASCAATSGRASAPRAARAEGVPMTLELTVTDLATAACRSPARPSTCGTAPAKASTRCTRRRRGRELPARRADRRRRGQGALHQHLPRLLRRSLAAHPLRGLPRPGGHHRRGQRDRHLAGRAAEGRLRPGVRPERLRGVGGEPRPAQPGRRQRLRRRRRRARQLATTTGDAGAGFTVALAVPVDTTTAPSAAGGPGGGPPPRTSG